MSSKPHIIVNKNTPMAMELFSRIGRVTGLDTDEVTREAVRDADVLVVRSETTVDEQLLDGSNVAFVGTVSIGTDHVDTDYLAARGIAFSAAPGSNANSVAEYVTSALLTWSARTGALLEGKTLGVVGVGNVGTKVVEVAKALGMKVILNDPPLAERRPDPAYRHLDELMDADIITLHVPLTKSGVHKTYHLFDATRLGAMKRGSVLINTSRGAVVDSQALSKALVTRHLSAAILDVWEREPNIDTALLDQVILGTPHIAGYSLDGKLNAVKMIFAEVCRHLNITPDASIPPVEGAPEDVRISVPASFTAIPDVVRHAVLQAYDIELDDSLLRQVRGMPAEERGKYFNSLRACYRVRREFFARVVELHPGQTEAQAVLQALGFKTEILDGEERNDRCGKI